MKNIRIGILLLFLLVSYVSVGWLRSVASIEAAPPRIELAEIPLQLDGWTGTDVEVDDETLRVVNAHSYINRFYHDGRGRGIGLHIAAWQSEAGEISPHHPEVCYVNAGWRIGERQQRQIEVRGGVVPLELILFRRGGEGLVTAHWYQAGDYRYTDGDSLNSQIFRLWGQKDRPATLKVLLQARRRSIDITEAPLLEFAGLVAQAMEALEHQAQLSPAQQNAAQLSPAQLTADQLTADQRGAAQR